MLALYDPAVAWDMSHWREWPDTIYEGHEGVRRFLEEWLAVWEDYSADAEEHLLAPDGRVVRLCVQSGRGRRSSLAMQMEWAQVYSVHEGLVVRVENWKNRTKALAEAGLA